MEAYLPLYFDGAMAAYDDLKRDAKDRQNHASYGKPVSKPVLEFMKSTLVMQRDLEFYEWILQRFDRQIKQLGSRCLKYLR